MAGKKLKTKKTKKNSEKQKTRKTLRQKTAKASKTVRDTAEQQSQIARLQADLDFTDIDGKDEQDLFRQAPWKAKFNRRMVENAEELVEIANTYFSWVTANPLVELKAMSSKDDGIQKVALPKMRAMTIEGLCVYMGISRDTWHTWGKADIHPDLSDAVKHINMIIKEQKFTGAAADLLNANVIIRDLGLSDKQEHGGIENQPIVVSSPTDRILEGLAKLRSSKE